MIRLFSAAALPRVRLLLAATAVLAATSACTTVDSISISQIPVAAEREAVVRAHSWSPMILLIPFGSGYIDDARKTFTSQCAGGRIEGVLSKYSTVVYFPLLYSTQVVDLEGYCVHSHKSGHNRRQRT
jgi:hypothetical protein